jgi:hypothetical protein
MEHLPEGAAILIEREANVLNRFPECAPVAGVYANPGET